MPFFVIPPIAYVGAAVIAGGAALYKYASSKNKRRGAPQGDSKPEPIRVGSFAVWGRPNVGKTTFISQLLGKGVPNEKEATGAKKIYGKEIPLFVVDGRSYKVEEIIDIPGSTDRLSDWCEMAAKKDHVFYIVDLSRKDDEKYKAEVRYDLGKTVGALSESSKARKRVNIIASHVDESIWSEIGIGEVNNVIQEDVVFRQLYEAINERGVAGYVYVANLVDRESFDTLMECIIRDCHA